MEVVPINQIDTKGRTLRPGDNLDELVTSLLDEGLKFPILMREDRSLIDGLRRLEAARLAGFSVINVITAYTFENAIAALTASHADHPGHRINYPPWRIYEIWQSLHGLARQNGSTRGVTHPSRQALSQALKLSSENVVQATAFVYQTAQLDSAEGEVAKKAIVDMEAGKINYYGGRLRIYKFRLQKKLMAEGRYNPSQARRTIDNASEQIGGITIALERVPRSIISDLYSSADAKTLWTKFYRLQRALAPIAIELYKRSKLSGEINE